MPYFNPAKNLNSKSFSTSVSLTAEAKPIQNKILLET